MKKSLKQRLTYPLIGLLVFITVCIGGFYYFNHLVSQPIEIKDIQIDTQAALKLNALNQISKRNGITEWELSAASARLLKNENKAVLEKISVTFFTKDDKQVLLTSDHGILDTKFHDMKFSDNVIITYGTTIMRTSKLQYSKKTHIIRSDSHVIFEHGSSTIEADSMVTKIDKNQTILKGRVKGYFNEDFKLQ